MRKFGVVDAWLRFTDEDSEGEWRDKWTGEAQEFFSIPWRLSSEPTGFEVENCTGFNSDTDTYYYAYDIGCVQRRPVACQDLQQLFRLRGLCAGSIIDRIFRLIHPLHNARRMMLGPSGNISGNLSNCMIFYLRLATSAGSLPASPGG